MVSLDHGATWSQLPNVTQTDMKKAAGIHRRFLGDPAYEYKPGKILITLIFKNLATQEGLDAEMVFSPCSNIY